MTPHHHRLPLRTLWALLLAVSVLMVGCRDDAQPEAVAPEVPVVASSPQTPVAEAEAAPPLTTSKAGAGDGELIAETVKPKPKAKPKAKPKPKARPVKPRTAAAKPKAQARRKGGRLLRVSHLFGNDKEDDRGAIRQYFDYTGYLTDAEFPGQEAGPYYNAYRLRTDRDGVFGYGIQVWKTPSGDDAMERFDALFAQSVGGVKGREIADRSFRAQHDGLRSLAFISRKQEAVVWLTCDISLCSFDQMLSFARSVKAKL